MALINLDLQYITLFWQLKFWAGFCELLGWKSSIQSGNTDSALCSLLWSRVMDVLVMSQNLPVIGNLCVNGAFPEKRRNVVTCVNSTFLNLLVKSFR